MSVQIQNLFLVYNELSDIVANHDYMQEGFSVVQNMFEDKKKNPDANIMVYGVYNAGKSTLINALLGKQEAETGDIPLTSTVTAYKCRNYIIFDTPGIDAPQEHENVTKQQLEKADAIIFVVNPSGVAEEQKTLNILMDLFKKGKKIFLVFNEKDKLSEEDYIKLKDQTRERLQDLAANRELNLKDTLSQIDIVKINAKTALKGKLENKQKLVEISGYVEFERQLEQFILNISQQDVYSRLKAGLIEFISSILEKIKSCSKNEIVKDYNELIRDLSTEKITLRQDMQHRIERNKNELYSQVKSWIYNQDDDIENQIQQWILSKSKLIETGLNDELAVCIAKVQRKIEDLQAKISALNANDSTIKVNPLDDYNPVIDSSDASKGINKEQLGQLAVSLSKNVKTEHIVAGLNMVKQYLPSLMKGIGKKTIEKWAGQIVGKTIPIVGVVITLGLSLHDMFSDDPETEKLKRQQEAEQRAIERRNQQIEDSAVQIADQFATSLSNATNSVIDDFFNQIVTEIKKTIQNFDEQDKLSTEVAGQLSELIQQVS